MAISTPARSTSTATRPAALTRDDRRVLLLASFLGAGAGILLAAPVVAALVVAGGTTDLTYASVAVAALVGTAGSAYAAVRGRFVSRVGVRVGLTVALLLGVAGGLLSSVVPGTAALVLGVLAECAGLGLVLALGLEVARGVRRPTFSRAVTGAVVPGLLCLVAAVVVAEMLADTGVSAQLLVVPTLALLGVLVADLALRDDRGRRF